MSTALTLIYSATLVVLQKDTAFSRWPSSARKERIGGRWQRKAAKEDRDRRVGPQRASCVPVSTIFSA